MNTFVSIVSVILHCLSSDVLMILCSLSCLHLVFLLSAGHLHVSFVSLSYLRMSFLVLQILNTDYGVRVVLMWTFQNSPIARSGVLM